MKNVLKKLAAVVAVLGRWTWANRDELRELYRKARRCEYLNKEVVRLQRVEKTAVALGVCRTCGQVPEHERIAPFSHCACGTQEDHAFRLGQVLQQAQVGRAADGDIVLTLPRRALVRPPHFTDAFGPIPQLNEQVHKIIKEGGSK